MNALTNDPNSELQRPDLPALGEAISIWFAISSPLPRPVIGFLGASGQEIFKSSKPRQTKAFPSIRPKDGRHPRLLSRLLTTAVATKCKEPERAGTNR
jgi:hypothetical protein